MPRMCLSWRPGPIANFTAKTQQLVRDGLDGLLNLAVSAQRHKQSWPSSGALHAGGHTCTAPGSTSTAAGTPDRQVPHLPSPQCSQGRPLQVHAAGVDWAEVTDALFLRLVRLRDRVRACAGPCPMPGAHVACHADMDPTRP